ncbi:MAG TPA: hypothetical protein VHA05_01675 [Candidatus Saccharimonadales bacterium]|nr:hypothetical protein [Candidatus Saccharimonadales bacterium]
MLFKYEVGIIAFAQFIILSLLSLANGLNSIISTCVSSRGQCVENMIPSIILFILTAAWFAVVWVLAYTVQERRGRKLTTVLLGAEFIIAMVALFSIMHHNDWLSLVTSAIDLLLALWVMLLAARIWLAGDSRVVSRRRIRSRARARRKPPTTDL